ncbi:Isoleucine--tRNA ligase [Mycoplasmopsis californica]|uniref:Isoleucine--tRNA ligase n=1 Tax=Mycoplasmopsis equigenitalium TaxID=114883 RepID=A0ABY5J0G9_9BACT|nr:isoleucine--tRNA ligase [Mycoplasmopsis equigenitalium]UUD36751.1 isoleucine--tRNA ligase [Mycoplasmopsis equigenitalium]VEU69954.1 Isoleucine--tRNA ligase [Mycoplasmopsis californica]
MDYKKTLNMPFTKFDMRGNLGQKEPLFRKKWQDMDLYKKILASNDHNNKFILHDGPPYANGDIHVGHALNKVLKDIVVRYKTMSGFYSPFVPGWDTHGLPIEHKMLTEMKMTSKDFSPFILRKKAASYALKQVERQKKQFELLQLQSNLKNHYVTLDKNYEIKQIRLFQKMWNDGLIYKGLKPVYWSPTSQSALAEAEVEYEDHVSPSIYVAFNVIKGNKFVEKDDKIIIWTTTPWTLIANSGVAISQKDQYTIVEHDKKRYIVATELADKLFAKFNWQNVKIIKPLAAKELIGVEYESPLNKNVAPVVYGHHVTLESGSGLVHIAPLFGEDDFLVGKKNNLKQIMHILDDGIIDPNLSEFGNIFYLDANDKILDKLTKMNLLIHSSKITHSFPHDWRTHKPIIFRGTPQWFVSIDKIRDKILKSLDDITFYNSWSKKRLSLMIKNRDDWTISRQRTWGVPIIAFYDKKNNIVLNDEIFDYVIKLIAEKGTDVWYELETDALLPPKYRGKNLVKENDIMDVWFDSGVSFLGVEITDANAPYDLYLEGSDQYRGWFNSSLINSVAYLGKPSYKNLISHGFTLDGNGEKMSKSKGNVVSPLDVVKEYGADILRLWVANSEYSNDISISDNILKQNVEIYRNIRNKIKFMLGNLNDYKHKKIKTTGVHEFIENQFYDIQAKIFNSYNNYSFIQVVKEVNNYLTDLSSFYLNIAKDILYVNKKDDPELLMIKYNLYNITNFLILVLSPILPTTCDDAYEFFDKKDKKESVHLEKFSKYPEPKKEIIESWNDFFKLRNDINLLIENAIKNKEINRSYEAKITFNASAYNTKFLEKLDLKTLLMVGEINSGKTNNLTKYNGIKCERCWILFPSKTIKNNLCQRCQNVVKEYEV